jgi:hypothetical protein
VKKRLRHLIVDMIHGCFYKAVTNQAYPRLGITVVADGHKEVTSVKVGADDGAKLKHLYSNDGGSSVTLGVCGDRAIFTSHMSGSCAGQACSCVMVATHFLQRPETLNSLDEGRSDTAAACTPLDEFVAPHLNFLKENVSYPYLMILSQAAEMLLITAYNAESFQCEKLLEGAYDFR